MLLRDILKAKGATVHTIPLTATLAEAARQLVAQNVGSLIVCDRDAAAGEKLAGIITERDILHVTAQHPGSLEAVKVADHMSRELITATPDDSVEAIMGLMTHHRVRHVPVMTGGHLVGIVSIGDVVKAQHDRLALENRFMKDYIQSQA